jgi:hypothetical protein
MMHAALALIFCITYCIIQKCIHLECCSCRGSVSATLTDILYTLLSSGIAVESKRLTNVIKTVSNTALIHNFILL